MALFNKIFGSYSDREIKKINPIVDKVLSYEKEMEGLTDAELKNKTLEFKQRYKDGEDLDSLMSEAFAVVREASWRVLGMKHFPVQIIGGIILHQGRIAEMKTGEGKTLVATLPSYLNAITGEGVHVVTVNDYLAQRDKDWMGKVHEFLGLTVGCIIHDLVPAKYRDDANYLARRINTALMDFVKGRLLMAVFVGVATAIVLLIFRVNFAIIVGLLTMIGDIIPYIGPFIAFVPAVLFAAMDSPIKALIIAACFVIIQWLENNILAGKLIGGTTRRDSRQ